MHNFSKKFCLSWKVRKDSVSEAAREEKVQAFIYTIYIYTYFFFYKHGLFLAEAGKEIEIATSKLTTMCLSVLIKQLLIRKKKFI